MSGDTLLGYCKQDVLASELNDGTCGDDAIVLFGTDKTPLCLPHFEYQLGRVRRVIDQAAELTADASRLLGGGG